MGVNVQVWICDLYHTYFAYCSIFSSECYGEFIFQIWRSVHNWGNSLVHRQTPDGHVDTRRFYILSSDFSGPLIAKRSVYYTSIGHKRSRSWPQNLWDAKSWYITLDVNFCCTLNKNGCNNAKRLRGNSYRVSGTDIPRSTESISL